MKVYSRIGAATALVLALAGVAAAQHTKLGNAPAAQEPGPFDVQTFGVFRDLMLRGDFTAKVELGAAMSRAPTTGVGAVSGARGEITIVDGRLIVSYGKADNPPPHAETAALLATARVAAWHAIQLDSDVPPSAVPAFIARTAKAHGLDPDKTFPFQLRGSFGPYVMHINVAPTGGPYGRGLPMAMTVQHKGDNTAGSVAGVHVSAALVGIATHHGERTHAHWVSADGATTAHLDVWGIRAGATLLLPKPE